jgi:hypothetical protein
VLFDASPTGFSLCGKPVRQPRDLRGNELTVLFYLGELAGGQNQVAYVLRGAQRDPENNRRGKHQRGSCSQERRAGF